MNFIEKNSLPSGFSAKKLLHLIGLCLHQLLTKGFKILVIGHTSQNSSLKSEHCHQKQNHDFLKEKEKGISLVHLPNTMLQKELRSVLHVICDSGFQQAFHYTFSPHICGCGTDIHINPWQISECAIPHPLSHANFVSHSSYPPTPIYSSNHLDLIFVICCFLELS